MISTPQEGNQRELYMYHSPDDGEENAMKTNEGPIGKPSLTPWPGQEAQPSRAKPLLRAGEEGEL